jgi:dTDP-4-dehydrorhamnose reductase
MLRLAADRDEIGVVADQRGCPTGAADVAAALATIAVRLIDDPAAPLGTYHFANAGEASWADLAAAVMEEARRHGLPHARIRPIATADFPTRAARPADSRLDSGRIARDYGIAPRDWRAMVAATVADIARTPHQGTTARRASSSPAGRARGSTR